MTAHYHDLAEHAGPVEGPHYIPLETLRGAGSRDQTQSLYYSVIKRGLDSLLVLLAAPIVLPLIALMALLVALDGSNPFYSQPRVGRNGRIYTMWKLRSMVPLADAKLEEYLATCPKVRAEWDSTQKLKCDPRITRIGSFLRKSSADELPQLWNVLTGDMSLVGPRPMMPEQRILYPGTAYYALRPGITGYWQISDRNHSTFASRAKHDARYAADLSLATDLSILVKTVTVVLHGTGY